MQRVITLLHSIKTLFTTPLKKEIPITYKNTQFESQLKNYLSQNETKNITYDIQKTINSLYTADMINMNEMMEKRKDEKGNQEIQKMREVMEKSKEEELKINSNFFNKYSLKILEKTSNSDLLDLSLKSFAGSIDIPKDVNRSFVILELAKSKIISENEMEDLIFYTSYFNKMKAHVDNDSDLYSKASHTLYKMTNPKGKFVYSRDLYNFLKHNPDKINESDKQMYEHIFQIFLDVSRESSIYESYYYLGEMFLNGDYVLQNIEKAYRYFCVAASYNHGLSFYKLYTLLKEKKIRKSNVSESTSLTVLNEFQDDEKSLMFRYLKRSAEEGYVEAQHELANCYMSGEICKIDYKLALAWHRQACRNGFILSYEPSGDLLYNGGSNLSKDKILSLVMYYTGYTKGLFQLKEKVMKVKEELVLQGEPLPEMILI